MVSKIFICVDDVIIKLGKCVTIAAIKMRITCMPAKNLVVIFLACFILFSKGRMRIAETRIKPTV
jgi:hypothetical protein